jgi:hypothetical protein
LVFEGMLIELYFFLDIFIQVVHKCQIDEILQLFRHKWVVILLIFYFLEDFGIRGFLWLDVFEPCLWTIILVFF